MSKSNLKLLFLYWLQKMQEPPYYGEILTRLHLRLEKKCRTEDIKEVVKMAEEHGIKVVMFGTLVVD